MQITQSADVYLSVIIFPQLPHSCCCVEPFLFVSDLLTSIVIVILATAPSGALKVKSKCYKPILSRCYQIKLVK